MKPQKKNFDECIICVFRNKYVNLLGGAKSGVYQRSWSAIERE